MTDQDLTLQREALARAGRAVIREKKVSSTSRQGRAELDVLLSFLREGDELIVTRVDRLARSIGDLQDIARETRPRKVALVATEEPVDTSTAAGKAFLEMLGVFAEFETNLRCEQQMKGIAEAKEPGVYKGRKPKLNMTELRRLRDEEMRPSAITEHLGVARSTMRRAMGRQGADFAEEPPVTSGPAP